MEGIFQAGAGSKITDESELVEYHKLAAHNAFASCTYRADCTSNARLLHCAAICRFRCSCEHCLDQQAIPSLSAQLSDMDASINAFEDACSSREKSLEEALVSHAFERLQEACDEIALTERVLSFATSLSCKLDNDASLVEALVRAEFPRDGQGNIDSRTTRADGSVLVIGEESRNAVRSALAMIRHGGFVVRPLAARMGQGGDVHSGESSSEDEVEYPDEDEQGLPEPDIKEYILRCVVRCSGDSGPPRKSTVHRLYAMVERKAAHLRLACAVSESEGPTSMGV